MFKQILELLMQNNYNVFVYNGYNVFVYNDIDLAVEGQITGVGEADFNIQGQCTITKEYSIKTFIIPHIAHLKVLQETKEAMIQVQ